MLPPYDFYTPQDLIRHAMSRMARLLAVRKATTHESREMLGIMEQLRDNGLAHSPATRPRKSSRMRVKLQLVLCSDEGHEETVTDVMVVYPTAADNSDGLKTG
jgi:hypothetical protein